MSAEVITLEAQEQKFSEYPAIMDDYFKNNEVIIKTIPSEYKKKLEVLQCDFRVTSATQYKEYLDQEIKYWSLHDPKDTLGAYSKIQNMKNARNEFDRALSYYKMNSSYRSSGDSCMRSSVGAISSGSISSRTELAQFMVNNIDKGTEFFRGLMFGLTASKTTSITVTVGVAEGFVAALEFQSYASGIKATLPDATAEIAESLNLAKEQLANLNREYTCAFHEQQQRLDSIKEKTNDHFNKLTEETEQYFAEKEKRCAELEALYTENLRLKAPAEYWKELEKEYSRKGGWWLFASVLFATLIVGALIVLVIKMPNMFSEDSHWFDIFKNSAIVTVVASVAIYILHLFVKLSISSLHLCRDARERSKLTVFYLSLIEGKAVTEKERAIVLNALFSRSDTGLLKGDSSPTMSATLSDLIEKIQTR